MEYFDSERENLELREKRLSTEEIFDGRILHVIKDRVLLPDGKEASREVVRHIGAVAVIPVDIDGCAVVERQFRYPINQVITEIPAGKLDYKGEDHLEAAKRELMEETGYTGDVWTELGLFYPAAAYTDEKIMIYMAQGLHAGARKLDEDEFLNVESMDLDEFADRIISGEIRDSKTQAAVLKVWAMKIKGDLQ